MADKSERKFSIMRQMKSKSKLFNYYAYPSGPGVTRPEASSSSSSSSSDSSSDEDSSSISPHNDLSTSSSGSGVYSKSVQNELSLTNVLGKTLHSFWNKIKCFWQTASNKPGTLNFVYQTRHHKVVYHFHRLEVCPNHQHGNQMNNPTINTHKISIFNSHLVLIIQRKETGDQYMLYTLNWNLSLILMY